MAVDEATSALLAQMADNGIKPRHEMTPEEARGHIDRHLAPLPA